MFRPKLPLQPGLRSDQRLLPGHLDQETFPSSCSEASGRGLLQNVCSAQSHEKGDQRSINSSVFKLRFLDKFRRRFIVPANAEWFYEHNNLPFGLIWSARMIDTNTCTFRSHRYTPYLHVLAVCVFCMKLMLDFWGSFSLDTIFSKICSRPAFLQK